jgi:hypothetical protein
MRDYNLQKKEVRGEKRVKESVMDVIEIPQQL